MANLRSHSNSIDIKDITRKTMQASQFIAELNVLLVKLNIYSIYILIDIKYITQTFCWSLNIPIYGKNKGLD